MDFTQLIKKYKYEVTNQDPEEYTQSADYAIENLVENLNLFLKNQDVDMHIAYLVQAMNDHFEYHLDRYNKRKQRNSQFNDAVDNQIERFSS